MKIIDIFKQDWKKVQIFFGTKSSSLISALQEGSAISTAILAWKTTSSTQTKEQLLESVIPKDKSWSSDAIKIADALVVDIAACSNPSSWKGIALRLLGEIAYLIDGGKLPTGIDGYIAEAQNIFLG